MAGLVGIDDVLSLLLPSALIRVLWNTGQTRFRQGMTDIAATVFL